MQRVAYAQPPGLGTSGAKGRMSGSTVSADTCSSASMRFALAVGFIPIRGCRGREAPTPLEMNLSPKSVPDRGAAPQRPC